MTENNELNVYDYDYQQLEQLPEAMKAWDITYEQEAATKFGKYALVEVTPAYIEMHHQVEIVDEGGDPLRGVWVMFGFHTGYDYGHLKASTTHWGKFEDLKGNMVKSNAMGYAQHTYGEGGEKIFVWDIDDQNVQKLSSDVVGNAKWRSRAKVGSDPMVPFNHTGIRLVFQRRVANIPVRSQRKRIENLEKTLQTMQETWSDERMHALVERIEEREKDLDFLESRVRVLELELEKLNQ